mmetsp:Transcript_18425/g.27839  ORF Transcript_18425/g.27839 Transcript_18425/m.27839 type:complete len:239 (+) Transcript_18425:179-895(+)
MTRYSTLLSALRRLDTSCLCDAEKALLRTTNNLANGYQPLCLMEGLVPRGSMGKTTTVGMARTVQCVEPDDFFAVLQGLDSSQSDEVLVVNTRNSQKAVAGELFCAEASRRGLTGIIIDGPMRDTCFLSNYPNVRCYSRSVTPYSGTISHPGEMNIIIECGGVTVESNHHMIVADDDGILVGAPETFQQLEQSAREIQQAEDRIRQVIANGTSLHGMTNYTEHLEALKKGESSSLKFL